MGRAHDHLELGCPLLAPVIQGLEERPQSLALLSQSVEPDTCAVFFPHDQALCLEIGQALGQHLVAEARDETSEVAISERLILQSREDHGLPLAAEEFQGKLDRTVDGARKAFHDHHLIHHTPSGALNQLSAAA